MKKMINKCHVEGYVYDFNPDRFKVRVTGPTSKNPGTPFISGELDIAVDEVGMNVVPVHFIYMTPVYGSGKANPNFNEVKKIIENPDKTWLNSGKDGAYKVKIDGSLGLNDFVSSDGQMVAAKRVEASFVSIVSELGDEKHRSTFDIDMVITRVNHIDANPEKNIDNDYVNISGAAFNFRNALLPVDFVVKNPQGMNYFEDLGVTNSEPVFTRISGKMVNQTIKVEGSTEETAWGESAAVNTYDRKQREWVVLSSAKVPYDFGEEDVLTAEELVSASQDRQVYLADVKRRDDEYKASKATTAMAAAPVANAPKAKPAEFTF